MVSKVKQAVRKIGLFKPPANAAAEGFDDFRPVSGFKPLIHMEPGPRTAWINEDLAPTPIQMRVWTGWSYVSLWLSANFDAGTWNGGAALITIGLTVGQSLWCAALGCLLCTIIAVAAARVGAVYHIGFPAWSRSTYGMWGSKVMVAFRGAVAIIWYAVQTFYGASMLDVVLSAIFGSGWDNIPNHLPASSGTTTKAMVAYFIFWVIQLPFLFVHPSTAKHVFMVKSWILPIAGFGFIGGMIHLAGGSIDFSLINTTTPLKGSALAWTFMNGLNAVFGTISPMLINQPDLGRYCDSPAAALWPQFGMMLTGKFFCFFIGMITSAACTQVYGVTTWNAWDIGHLILEHNGTRNWRVGLAFFGLTQCFGTVATNLFANTIPFGADMSGTFPKYLNIIRGQMICVVFSWAICPWLILTSGIKFVQFLGSYTVFMASLLAILLVDYYVLRRGNIHVPSLYDADGDRPNPKGLYYIGPKSFNWKAFTAWTIGIVPIVPGLAYTFEESTSSVAATFIHLYQTGFVLCFGISAVLYYALNVMWPVKVFPEGHEDTPFTFEALGPVHGYYPEEKEILFGRGVLGSSSDSTTDVENASSGNSIDGKSTPLNEKGNALVNVVSSSD